MTTDEGARLHLYELARTALDEAAADTLMNTLPRDPDRFATKVDLAVLDAHLRGEIQRSTSGLLRALFFGMVASNATLVGLVLAAVRLG